ncbi:MAG: CdaR family protein [Hornefia sp.]|nr:CdaR family protein [Hornefia sp.]
MLQSKKANLLIALILAIVLWIYVIGELDPETTKVYRSVPVMIQNEQVLENHGLSVKKLGKKTITVRVSGKRRSIYRLKASEIKVSADVENAVEGENNISLEVKVPDKISLEEQSLAKVNVSVEKRVSENRNVDVKYIGKLKNGYEPSTKGIFPKKIQITGGKSQVAKVENLKAEIKLSRVEKYQSNIETKVVPVDKDGKEVGGIKMDPAAVNVQPVLYKTKTVNLNIKIKGANSGRYKRSYKLPKSITVKGMESALAKIESVEAEDIDISKVNSDKEIVIKPILYGVEVSNNTEKLVLSVTVKKN